MPLPLPKLTVDLPLKPVNIATSLLADRMALGFVIYYRIGGSLYCILLQWLDWF